VSATLHSYILATKSTVGQQSKLSPYGWLCCRYGRLCHQFWQQIGNNLNSTACRGWRCRQFGRLCRPSVERHTSFRLCHQCVCGQSDSFSTKSTVWNLTLSPVCTGFTCTPTSIVCLFKFICMYIKTLKHLMEDLTDYIYSKPAWFGNFEKWFLYRWYRQFLLWQHFTWDTVCVSVYACFRRSWFGGEQNTVPHCRQWRRADIVCRCRTTTDGPTFVLYV